MYRFRIYLPDSTLNSSKFDDFEECEKTFDKLHHMLRMEYKSVGCSIEEYIENIGWVVRDE
jgi:hypothetical protein